MWLLLIKNEDVTNFFDVKLERWQISEGYDYYKFLQIFFKFLQFVMTSSRNRGNHWVLSIIFLLLLWEATSTPNWKFLS